MELWKNNPRIQSFSEEEADIVLPVHYPLINRANQWSYHFIHGYAQYIESKLDIRIPITDFKPEIFLSTTEKAAGPLSKYFINRPYWVVGAGGKYDYTTKWWPHQYFQEVVDSLPEILFVQVGTKDHFHPPLKNVINLVGKTSLRDVLSLVYHAQGVLCPHTFLMHVAVACNTDSIKPCVVLAGGREASHWFSYNGHKVFHKVGSLSCCSNGGCWKSRCTIINDGDKKNQHLCERPIEFPSPINTKIFDSYMIPQCMTMIKPEHVVTAIKEYYEGGILKID